MTDIVLSGIPRSGTTLTCHLLNKLPDVVALHEPITNWGDEHDVSAVCNRVDGFFAEARASLLAEGTAQSKHVNGVVPDNSKGDYSLPARLKRILPGSRRALRKGIDKRGVISVEKPLSPGFSLCVKHVGRFAAILAPLQDRGYVCHAIVRHPLAVLASWNSIDFAPYHGRMHAAERLDPDLSRRLGLIDDRLERQIHLLNWFFDAFHRHLPASHIYHYEEIIRSKGASLQNIVPQASRLDEPLQSKNRNSLYDQDLMHELSVRLQAAEGAFWHFYSRDALENDCAEMMEPH